MATSATTFKDAPHATWQSPQLKAAVDQVIERALAEDFDGQGDITCDAIVPPSLTTKATALVKGVGVVAGLDIFSRVFEVVDKTVTIEKLVEDGTFVEEPKVAAVVNGSAKSILMAERTALNLVQRLSGIATMTRQFVNLATPHCIKILDTRKTTAGLRLLEKYAVTVGGGTNHRFGLYDKILIKDNHIAIAGSVSKAIAQCRAMWSGHQVEVEVTNLEQLQEALIANAEHIMLDNMSPATIVEAVKMVEGRAFIEISGGVNLNNIHNYLIAGVDAISIGALTHSPTSLDISLEVEV